MANPESFQTRAQREMETYNEGLKRATYNRVMAHADRLHARKRDARAGEIIARAPHDRALELGSRCWVKWLEAAGNFPSEFVCINISQRELNVGIEAARHTRLQPRFEIMDAHQLAFPDGHFDVVFGTGMLHHLELERALGEIRRVLKPGGVMLFLEPQDNNPIGRIVRRLTPAARTEDEMPFVSSTLALLKRYFDCTFHFEQLAAVPVGVMSAFLFRDPDNVATRAAFSLDEWLLTAVPTLGPYARYVLVEGHKPA